MARPKSVTTTTVENTSVEPSAEVLNDTVETKTIKKKVVEPLNDSDEIEVISLIPNISYKDSRTNDFYEWDEVGHIEYMTVDTLKNLWRNNKGYFKNLWLKPMSDRLIEQFGLKSTFENYEFLMDASNYNKANIDEICNLVSNIPNGLKFSVYNKIKDMVANGEVNDISIVKRLANQLDIDLISMI